MSFELLETYSFSNGALLLTNFKRTHKHDCKNLTHTINFVYQTLHTVMPRPLRHAVNSDKAFWAITEKTFIDAMSRFFLFISR